MKKTATNITKILLSMLFALLIVCTVAPDEKVNAADIPAVTGLQQTKYGTSSAEISFTALLDNNVYYSIQLSSQPNTGFTEYTYTTNGSAYIYNLPNAGSSYYVRVVPYLRSGSYGSDPNTKDSYLHDDGTPSAPIELVTAPNSKPATITHTKSTTTSITLSWSAVTGANTYAIAYAQSGTSTDAKIVYTNATSYTITGLAKNGEYTIYVYPARKSSTGLVALNSSSYAYLYAAPVAPSKASKPVVEYWWNSSSQIQVSTNSISCADGYEYQVYTAYNSKAKKVKTATAKISTSVTIKYKNFKKYQYYKVRVRAYSLTSSGTKAYGSWSSWTYACPSPKVNLKKSGNNLKASWSKVTGAKRYVVYVSNKKDSGYKKFTTTKKTSCTINKYGKKKLSKKNTYYVYVAPQIKVGKKYVTGLPEYITYYYLY